MPHSISLSYVPTLALCTLLGPSLALAPCLGPASSCPGPSSPWTQRPHCARRNPAPAGGVEPWGREGWSQGARRGGAKGHLRAAACQAQRGTAQVAIQAHFKLSPLPGLLTYPPPHHPNAMPTIASVPCGGYGECGGHGRAWHGLLIRLDQCICGIIIFTITNI